MVVRISLIIIGLFIVLSCSKEDGYVPGKIKFNGVTYAVSTWAEGDSTDWTFSDSIDTNIYSFFSQINLDKFDTSMELYIEKVPNPLKDLAHITINSRDPFKTGFSTERVFHSKVRFDYAIVDKNYQLIMKDSWIPPKLPTTFYARFIYLYDVPKNDTFRIYYMLSAESKQYFGHGDIVRK